MSPGRDIERPKRHIVEGDIDLAADLTLCVAGNTNAARLRDPLKAHRNIDCITKDVVFVDDNITDVNPDAEFDPLVLRHIDILFGHAALNFVGTSHGVDQAGELNEGAVPGILDYASVMFSDFGIEKRLSESFQLRQRAFFVDPYQAARARDIRRQNSCQPPLYVLAAQDAPPKLGEFYGYIAELWTNVGLRPMSETGQKAPSTRRCGRSVLPPGADISVTGRFARILLKNSAVEAEGDR